MYVFSTRDWRVFAVLALVAAAVVGLGLYCPEVVEGYVESRLAQFSWGQGQGEVGWATGRDGRMHGPRSFAVDNQGYVYLADTFNARIAVIDDGGGWLSHFDFPPDAGNAAALIQDIGVDRRRNIYAADYGGSGVYRFDHVGNLLDKWELNQQSTAALADMDHEGLWITSRLHVEGPGRLLIARTKLAPEQYRRELKQLDFDEKHVWDLASTTLREAEGDNWQEVEAAGSFHTFAVSNRGMLVTEQPRGPFERAVAAWKAGKQQWQVVVATSHYVEEAALIGVDSLDRIYLGVNLNGSNGVIYRLNREGVEARLTIPGPAKAVANVYARVASNGDIYVLRTADEGLNLNKYEYTRRWSLRPRWWGQD